MTTVTTVEELRALTPGTILLDRVGDVLLSLIHI